MNAARALAMVPVPMVIDVMERLIADPNARVRLIAAGALLAGDPQNAMAISVLTDALEDPARAVSEAARVLLDSVTVPTVAPVTGPDQTTGKHPEPALAEIA